MQLCVGKIFLIKNICQVVLIPSYIHHWWNMNICGIKILTKYLPLYLPKKFIIHTQTQNSKKEMDHWWGHIVNCTSTLIVITWSTVVTSAVVGKPVVEDIKLWGLSKSLNSSYIYSVIVSDQTSWLYNFGDRYFDIYKIFKKFAFSKISCPTVLGLL